MSNNTGKRWSGADWADQQKMILMIGCGGISSWTALSLSRIDHELIIVDPDVIDATNVSGGQLFRQKDIGRPKVEAVTEICSEFGCTNLITPIQEFYSPQIGMIAICICGLDNMKARREVFEAWIKLTEEQVALGNPIDKCLFIDGRLTLEMYEIFTIRGDDTAGIQKYLDEHLFTDEEAQELDCTQKQSTFAAMGIAAQITGTLCNWLTNQKMAMDFREVPFYQRMHFPMTLHQHSNQIIQEQVVEKEIIIEKVVEREVLRGVREEYPGEIQKLRSFHRLVGSLQTECGHPSNEVHIISSPIAQTG